MNKENFVFEIGVEEIPARFVPLFQKELEDYFVETLQKEMLSYTQYTIIATPRRIGIYIQDLASVQESKEEVVLGPSVIASWNNGKTTPALEGFLKKYAVKEKDVFTQITPKGEYVAVKHIVGGKQTVDILSTICYNAILQLSSIQKMRWASSRVVFARPIASLLALYGATSIALEYGECISLTPPITYGNRIVCNKALPVTTADEYFTVLEKAYVIPFPTARKEKIQKGIREIEQQCKGTIVHNEELLDENVNLCEYPFVLLGDVEEKYLALPKEVFLTTIQSHQRSFGLLGAQEKLLPHFITISNNPNTGALIKTGWERVLRARLEDAMFFYALDKESTFETWLEQLEHVTFITSLGNMKERALRLQALSLRIAALLVRPDEADFDTIGDNASKAGLLCKADLVSAVVKEFDTLQGVMGYIYAKEKGKGDKIAFAIKEHYLPLGPSTPIPSTMLGCIIALADKIDMVIGCFAMDMIPTGTTDTQGLRRAVLGIVRIILEKEITVDFREIFLSSKALYGIREWKLLDEDMLQELSTFFAVRIKQYFLAQGYETTCIDAVLSIRDSLPALAKRIKAMHTFITKPEAKEVCVLFKRLSNIVAKEQNKTGITEKDCIPELFAEEAEKALYTVILEVLPRMRECIALGEYQKAIKEVYILQKPLQNFFDTVLVLTEDSAVRNNRLTLLNSIVCILMEIADFKELQL